MLRGCVRCATTFFFASIVVWLFVSVDAGSISLYRQVGLLKAANARGGDYLGGGDAFDYEAARMLSISLDGRTIAAGCYLQDSIAGGIITGSFNLTLTADELTDSGAAYVWTRDPLNDSWQQQAFIKARFPQAFAKFGWSIALSGDGNLLVVGSPGESSSACCVNGDETLKDLPMSGAVFVFRRLNGTIWTQDGYLKASTPQAFSRFGWSVALSSDGSRIFVGSPFRNGGLGYVHVFHAGDVNMWTEVTILSPPNAHPGGSYYFGWTIAIDETATTLAIAAIDEDTPESGVTTPSLIGGGPAFGAVYVFNGNYTLDAFMKPPPASELSFFGNALSLSSSGDVLVISTPFDHSNGLPAVGRVYIFERKSSVWILDTVLMPPPPIAPVLFYGVAVALHTDGNFLIVGSSREFGASRGVNPVREGNEGSLQWAGAVHMYSRSNTSNWKSESPAYFKPSNTDEVMEFGVNIGISLDGTIVSAAPGDSSSPGSAGLVTYADGFYSGAIFVFSLVSEDEANVSVPPLPTKSILLPDQTILFFKASNTVAAGAFGRSAAISGDGLTLVVGSPGEGGLGRGVNADPSLLGGNDAGAAYVYSKDSAGKWVFDTYIKSSNAASNQFFGMALSLSADGHTLAVGAFGDSSLSSGVNGDDSDTSGEYVGACFIFHRHEGNWTQIAYIKASNPGSYDLFGNLGGVSVSGDGMTVAVASIQESSSARGVDPEGGQALNDFTNAGAVYLFHLDYESGNWSQTAYVKASNTKFGSKFGNSVSLSYDGSLLCVSAPNEPSNGTGVNGNQQLGVEGFPAPSSGAVYLFSLYEDSWNQTTYLKASNARSGSFFGSSCVCSGDGRSIAVGAVGEDSSSIGVDPPDGGEHIAAPTSGAVYLPN